LGERIIFIPWVKRTVTLLPTGKDGIPIIGTPAAKAPMAEAQKAFMAFSSLAFNLPIPFPAEFS
jgi:hypothetical protein